LPKHKNLNIFIQRAAVFQKVHNLLDMDTKAEQGDIFFKISQFTEKNNGIIQA
jgi:hypothetical protein